MRVRRQQVLWVFGAVLALCTSVAGCCTCKDFAAVDQQQIPRELEKVTLPAYVVEPPDILLIDALRTIPKTPYHIDTGDILTIQYTGEVPVNQPVGGQYQVDPEGMVLLSPFYGGVTLRGLTLEQATIAVEDQLKKTLQPQFVRHGTVAVSLSQSRGLQQIRGPHLVRPDGTISLGTYGSVNVAGHTLDEVRKLVEEQLSNYMQVPEVEVDVAGYNSKVYYVILDQGDVALQMWRLPVTGNETVLDALAQLNGLPPLTTRHHVWLARPSPAENGCSQVMPVNLVGITECAETGTNYQVLPGDRIFVKTDPLIRFDQVLTKIYTPVERTFGILLLGSAVPNALRHGGGGAGGTGAATGG